jgi:peptidyl serine alpha-galactosyltransferase
MLFQTWRQILGLLTFSSFLFAVKAYGLRHWMEQSLGLKSVDGEGKKSSPAVEDDIVILMDPDMILLRPLTHDFSDVDNHIWVQDNPDTRIVRHGYPMAQQDGYLMNEWMQFDVAYITNQTRGNYVPMPGWKDGPIHWNTGPPYLATVRECPLL